MKNNLRVLHVVGQLEPGGVATWLRTLFERASCSSIEWSILCNYRKGPGPYSVSFRESGTRIHHVPLTGNVYDYMGRVKKLIKSHDIHVVHDHRSYFAGPTLRAARLAAVKGRIAYHHGPDDGHITGPVRRLYHRIFKRMLIKNATHVWGCSSATMDGQYGVGWRNDSRFDIMYGSVAFKPAESPAREEIRTELNVSKDQPVIMTIGRLTHHKNPGGIIRTALGVLKSHPSAVFVVVGDGPAGERMRSLASQSAYGERIRFTGFRKDIPSLLAAADLFFQPSYSEGFPLGILEALYSGLPVVASNVPGILEALPPEMHAGCSDPDNIDVFSQTIPALLKQSTDRYVPVEFLRRFSPEIMAKRLTESYLAMVENPRRGAT